MFMSWTDWQYRDVLVHRMRMVVFALLALGACSKSQEERAADELGGFRDRMCACDSSECKKKVKDDLTAWEKSEMGEVMKRLRGAWIDEVEAKMRECRRATDDIRQVTGFPGRVLCFEDRSRCYRHRRLTRAR